MHARRLAAAALLSGSIACALPLVGRGGPVRVLVYNIHAGKDATGRSNLEDLAALVRSTSADIVLLQEVDRGTRRSGGVDQLRVLEERTRFAGVFGRTLDFDGGQYGIAALSRHGFAYQETLPLVVSPAQTRAGGSHEPRAALVTVANTRRGRWQAVTTHLDASPGDEFRLQEAQRLREILLRTRSAGVPLLVGGDLNSTPESRVVEAVAAFGLRDAWVECGQGRGLTFPADVPSKRIDYLFLDATLRCTSARVLETTISDHRPLLVVVTRR